MALLSGLFGRGQRGIKAAPSAATRQQRKEEVRRAAGGGGSCCECVCCATPLAAHPVRHRPTPHTARIAHPHALPRRVCAMRTHPHTRTRQPVAAAGADSAPEAWPRGEPGGQGGG
jgi:hypothetical protein